MMKKNTLILLIALFCLLLTACSSSGAAAAEPSNSSTGSNEITILEPSADDDFGDIVIDDSAASEPYYNDADYSQGLVTVDFSDFNWGGEVMNGNVPEDAYYPTINYMVGEWKYSLGINFADDGSYFEEIGLADVTQTDDGTTTFVLHPQMAQDGYEAWPEAEDEVNYEPFTGGFDENDDFKLVGNNAIIYLYVYYDYEGREYIAGEIYISEEDYGAFLMTRGQE